MLTRDRSAFPTTVLDERRLDRRRFLWAAGAGTLLAFVGDRFGRAREAAGDAPLVSPGALASLGAGEARGLTAVDGRDVLAVRLDADTVVAFDRRCPHLGCPVRWVAERGRFECPCHHAAFDARTGAVLFGPPTRGLTPATVLS